MPLVRALPVVGLSVLVPCATGQITPVIQERSVQTQAMVSSGGSSGDSEEAPGFGPFVQTVNSTMTGAAGASADATAFQDSVLGSTLITGTFHATGIVSTGTTFITGESDAQSNFLYIFNLANPTPIQFLATGELAFVGRNPDGEPSDLAGLASVRLLNAITEEPIAAFQLNGDAATDSASFTGTLAAGQYVILASARMHAFSADLLGPPPRSGSGDASASFSLSVVPAPGTAALFGLGVVTLSRRRR